VHALALPLLQVALPLAHVLEHAALQQAGG
jgi:hypothetical protein